MCNLQHRQLPKKPQHAIVADARKTPLFFNEMLKIIPFTFLRAFLEFVNLMLVNKTLLLM